MTPPHDAETGDNERLDQAGLQVGATIDRASWIQGMAAELAGGDDRVTDMQLEDAHQLWNDIIELGTRPAQRDLL